MSEESKQLTLDVTLHGDWTASIKYGPNLEQEIASTTQHDYQLKNNVGINNSSNFPWYTFLQRTHIRVITKCCSSCRCTLSGRKEAACVDVLDVSLQFLLYGHTKDDKKRAVVSRVRSELLNMISLPCHIFLFRVSSRLTVILPDSVSPILKVPSSDPVTNNAPSGDTSILEIYSIESIRVKQS